ncbi:hypothetical protein [Neotabrizicola sp. VNH66]|uniref:hypothetical protein n=1 Tax=Neotabrizicola sp. VNH66 TaxID=3400918 RepID=UPI003C06391B
MMHRLCPLALLLAVAACAPLPDLDAVAPPGPAMPPPALRPLDQVLAQVPGASTDPAAALDARAARLRARAAALRAAP